MGVWAGHMATQLELFASSLPVQCEIVTNADMRDHAWKFQILFPVCRPKKEGVSIPLYRPVVQEALRTA